MRSNIKAIEPMVNMYHDSKDYGKPFGIRIYYKNGSRDTFCGNLQHALCIPMTKKERKYVEALISDIENTKWTYKKS